MIASPQNEQLRQIAPLPTKHKTTPLFLPQSLITHDPGAGINPLVDACSSIFSTSSQLKNIRSLRQLSSLQNELIQEINSFQALVKGHGYNTEYITVCRYVLCAFLDDIIANTPWGSDGRWDSYSLLDAFQQDIHHHDKFFGLIERCFKEPMLYIDLMELIYICLSLGYKGQYRSTEHSQYHLEQITDNLYQHIRVYRGNYSKILSPQPLKTIPSVVIPVTKKRKAKTSPGFVFLMTGCIILSIFIVLGYLMDMIADEAFKNVKEIRVSAASDSGKL